MVKGVASGLFIIENNKVTVGYSNLYHFCFTPWYSLTVLTLLAWLQIKKMTFYKLRIHKAEIPKVNVESMYQKYCKYTVADRI